MILAGDIGGTKTNLALYDWTVERTEPVRLESFHSRDYTSLEDILQEFLEPPTPPTLLDGSENSESSAAHETKQPMERITLAAACFGIAGPVIDNYSQTTNLPWIVDGASIAKQFNIPRVQLLNDLEATAYGVLLLRPDEIEVLNPGVPPKKRQALVLIAAGTGLGEAILFWDGKSYRPMPSEGGHADFAPNNDNEIELLRYLRSQYLHVSYERLLSGPGLHAIYEYLRDTKKNEPTWLAEKVKAGALAPDAIDEHLFAAHLETADIPDPDLLIRTSGERRISNFLLWQTAYSEFVFTDTLWPDFGEAEFEAAVSEFHSRDRRYGTLRG